MLDIDNESMYVVSVETKRIYYDKCESDPC